MGNFDEAFQFVAKLRDAAAGGGSEVEGCMGAGSRQGEGASAFVACVRLHGFERPLGLSTRTGKRTDPNSQTPDLAALTPGAPTPPPRDAGNAEQLKEIEAKRRDLEEQERQVGGRPQAP